VPHRALSQRRQRAEMALARGLLTQRAHYSYYTNGEGTQIKWNDGKTDQYLGPPVKIMVPDGKGGYKIYTRKEWLEHLGLWDDDDDE
jgi:hypothetical protein